MDARRWLMGRITEAGLTAEIDGIGNVYGWDRQAKRKVLSGSHLETQNRSGWLDGAMGVIYALEAARSIRENPSLKGLGVDVAAFCDEEGHFISYLGSRSLVGDLSEAEMDSLVNRETGQPLRDALSAAGLAGLPRHRLAAKDYVAYVEGHIEQGNTLENKGATLGIVSAIVGNWQYEIEVLGQQNHAGSTRMAQRRDAGLELVRLLGAIDARFPALVTPDTVWTTGKIVLDPGAKSIVPGKATALFQFRDVDERLLTRLGVELEDILKEANANGRCQITATRISMNRPALMDAKLQQSITNTAQQRYPGASISMPSGAGHDGLWLSTVLPTAMLFVPSIGGISHHWSEDTCDDDITRGAEVFTASVVDMLREPD
jgi:N-carbamoyl-L-amino-acid hydrolase